MSQLQLREKRQVKDTAALLLRLYGRHLPTDMLPALLRLHGQHFHSIAAVAFVVLQIEDELIFPPVSVLPPAARHRWEWRRLDPAEGCGVRPQHAAAGARGAEAAAWEGQRWPARGVTAADGREMGTNGVEKGKSPF